jgi:hypothetical protein
LGVRLRLLFAIGTASNRRGKQHDPDRYLGLSHPAVFEVGIRIAPDLAGIRFLLLPAGYRKSSTDTIWFSWCELEYQIWRLRLVCLPSQRGHSLYPKFPEWSIPQELTQASR